VWITLTDTKESLLGDLVDEVSRTGDGEESGFIGKAEIQEGNGEGGGQAGNGEGNDGIENNGESGVNEGKCEGGKIVDC
jgi:hypothetical protein